MVLFFAMTLICAFFIRVDIVPLYRSKNWLAFWVYSIILSSVYILNILISLDLKIPSPTIPLEKMVSKIWGL